MKFFLIQALFVFFLAVQASPMLSAPRLIIKLFEPDITSPNDSTVWCMGQTETVEWYILSSRQTVIITESLMIQGTLTMPPKISQIPLLSSWLIRITVRVLSVFRLSPPVLLTSATLHWLAASPLMLLAKSFSLLSGELNIVVPANIKPGRYQIIRESVLVKNLSWLSFYHLYL